MGPWEEEVKSGSADRVDEVQAALGSGEQV